MSKSFLSLAVMFTVTAGVMAQTADRPVLRHVAQAEQGSHIMGVSDNGLWAVGHTSGDDGTYMSPRMVDVAAGTLVDLFGQGQAATNGEAWDVADDGKTVAGSWQSTPAIYYTDKERWRVLPLPSGYDFNDGKAVAITSDGKFAVGYAYYQVAMAGGGIGWMEQPLAWDLSGNSPELVDVPGLPDFDLEGEGAMQVRLLKVTNDKRYIFGQVNFSYPMTSWCFLYDMETKTWKPLGYDYDGERLTLGQDGCMVDDMCFSPDGNYAAVSIYSDEGGEIGYYDLATGKITVIPGSSGRMLGDIDNFGCVYASAPSTPMRDWSFYADGYWFDWKVALKQLWGLDWQADFTKDDYGLSGTYVGTSADGLRLFASEYSGLPGGAYLIIVPKPLKEYSADLDPLSNHYVFPTSGSSFSAVRNVTVYFDREIEVVGDRRSVKLLDDQGEEAYSSISVAVESGQPRNLTVSFRNAELEAGKTYTLSIPAGTVQIKGDADRKNKEIRVQYVGRANEPVKPVKISPESGTAMPRLSMSTNPVTVQFDAQLSVLDGGSIGLYRENGDGETEFLYALSSNVDGNTMSIYPVAEQQLAKDVVYKVVIEPNTVGDIAGNNGNEKVEITYVGTYEEDTKLVDGVVFQENFDLGLSRMLLYDGDQRTPVSSMASWGFKSEYPWWYVRDSEESADQSAASHSMYDPAGKSDDWMVTPRLYIPDETCELTFDSQSYKKNKEDILNVYILTTPDIYTAPITANFINRFKEEGELVYSEKQDPGASEELLAGDWRSNTVKLDKYAGKYIYIAFVNENENQSAIFLDNLFVRQALEYTIGVNAPSFVVEGESLPVKVVLSVLGDETYDEMTLRLLDGERSVLEEQTLSGLGLKKGDIYEHTFAKELPLVKGRINEYIVEAQAGEKVVTMANEVKNLRFQPERTIVIEEGTGTQCGYCPLGHRALELMDEIYGDKVIPVAIHSYTTGSEYLTSWTSAYGTFMGFTAYPYGVLNREQGGSPMYANANNEYMLNSPDGSTWFDIAEKMMSDLTDAEIHIDHSTIDADNGLIEVGMDMRYAYDSDNTNLNVFTVVLENGLEARQSSNVGSNQSSILGDWGAGGKYGNSKPKVPFNHVARGMHGTSYAGVSGMFPRVIDSSETYKSVYSFDIPKELSDVNNAEVVVMLVDANTGKIINAAKSPCLVGVVGVDEVLDGTDRNTGDVYSVTGIKVLENATIEDVNRLEKGIYIFNGKKVMVR